MGIYKFVELSDAAIKEIRESSRERGELEKLSKKFGISKSVASKIRTGKSYKGGLPAIKKPQKKEEVVISADGIPWEPPYKYPQTRY